MRLPDIQNEPDERGIALDEVGITNLRYPVTFSDGQLEHAGIAQIEITVALPASRRGTHMSRMVELVDNYLREFDPRAMPTILKSAAHRFDAEGVRIAVDLSLATPVKAPASGRVSWQTHDVRVMGQLDPHQTTVDTSVSSDVTSLCPCSKAISDYGAHNQRSQITLTTSGSSDDPYPFSVSEAVHLIRAVGSCPVYPVVKRHDERAITMEAYDNPAFVEDMARDLSQVCRRRGLTHSVQVRSMESIHSHDAIAGLTWRVETP